jgi:PAS domain S-box-containing protein
MPSRRKAKPELQGKAEKQTPGRVAVPAGITESQRAEKAPQAREPSLQSFLQHVPVAIAMFDRKMNYVAASQRWTRDYGGGYRDLVGLNHYDVRPDTPDRWREIHRRGLAGETHSKDEDRWLQADGTKSWLSWTVSPWRDARGNIGGIMILAEDITAFKVTENALGTSERKLRTLSRAVEQSPVSVLITSPSGQIEYVNAKFTEVTGYSGAEVLGKNPRLLKSGRQSSEFYKEMWDTITAGHDWRGQFCNRRKNGELFWEFAVIAPIQDPKGGVTHFVALREDITERKMLAQQVLDIAEFEQRRIGQDLHDDLCQLLAGLQLFSGLLEHDLAAKSLPEAAAAARLSAGIRESVEHARMLARGLSPVLPAGGGLGVALKGLAENVAALFHVQCDCFFDSGLALQEATTATHLYRIAQEAITNAVKHGHAKKIVIKLSAQGDDCQLAITDDGFGFATQHEQHEGMGLRTMEYRAETIGASLDVNSAAGIGTSVICTLPKGVCFLQEPG